MQLKKRTARNCSTAKGGALIESVVILGVITMLAMGSVQYGFAFYFKHAIQQAASAGCRAATMPGAMDSQVRTAVTNQLTAAGFANANPTVTTSPASINLVTQGTYVTVTVSSSWTTVGINPLPAYLGGFASNRVFSASATMLHE